MSDIIEIKKSVLPKLAKEIKEGINEGQICLYQKEDKSFVILSNNDAYSLNKKGKIIEKLSSFSDYQIAAKVYFEDVPRPDSKFNLVV